MDLVSGTDAWPSAGPPPGHARRRLCLIGGHLTDVDTCLDSQRSDSRPRCSLRRRNPTLPPVHRRERHAKVLGKLLLRQVQPGADGL